MTGVQDTGAWSHPVDRLGKPPVTARLRAAACAAPGQNVFVIDPEFDPDGAVPGWAVRGYYPSSPAGAVQEQQWVPNPGYRPGPLTRGWPPPRNRLDRALQLVAAGYRPLSVLLAALCAADVSIATAPEHPNGIAMVGGADGAERVLVFTAPDSVPVGTASVIVRVADLLPLLARVVVVINPGLVPSVRVAGTALAAAITSSPMAAPEAAPPVPQPPADPGRTP